METMRIKLTGKENDIKSVEKELSNLESVIPMPEEYEKDFEPNAVTYQYFTFMLGFNPPYLFNREESAENAKKLAELVKATGYGADPNTAADVVGHAGEMMILFQRYGSPTAKHWMMKHWGVSKQPNVTISNDGLDIAPPFENRTILDLLCAVHNVKYLVVSEPAAKHAK